MDEKAYIFLSGKGMAGRRAWICCFWKAPQIYGCCHKKISFFEMLEKETCFKNIHQQSEQSPVMIKILFGSSRQRLA